MGVTLVGFEGSGPNMPILTIFELDTHGILCAPRLQEHALEPITTQQRGETCKTAARAQRELLGPSKYLGALTPRHIVSHQRTRKRLPSESVSPYHQGVGGKSYLAGVRGAGVPIGLNGDESQGVGGKQSLAGVLGVAGVPDTYGCIAC